MSNLAIDLQNELAEYEARLQRFDWMYEYTDSHNIYWKFRNELSDLQAIALKGPQFAELFAKYSKKG
jgi:hypothetical protein